MKLPEKLYYTLEEAAEMASCKVSDLLHFAANETLEICLNAEYGVHVANAGANIYSILLNAGKWIGDFAENILKDKSSKGFEIHTDFGDVEVHYSIGNAYFISSCRTLLALPPGFFRQFETAMRRGELPESFDLLEKQIICFLPKSDKVRVSFDSGEVIEADQVLHPIQILKVDDVLPSVWEEKTDFIDTVYFYVNLKSHDLYIGDLLITSKELERLESMTSEGADVSENAVVDQLNISLKKVSSESEAPNMHDSQDAPRQRQDAQENRILQLLKQQKYDPQKLPEYTLGRPGVKSEIRELALKEARIFASKKVFDKAWGRLSRRGKIQYDVSKKVMKK